MEVNCARKGWGGGEGEDWSGRYRGVEWEDGREGSLTREFVL